MLENDEKLPINDGTNEFIQKINAINENCSKGRNV